MTSPPPLAAGGLPRLRGRPVAAALFDLDGTLMDTAHDIALALQRALAERSLPAPDTDAVRTMIGKGAPTLVRRASVALGLGLDEAAQGEVLEGFFRHYGRLQETGETRAQPYPGVREGLRTLHASGLPMGVVTNKQHRFAVALLRMRGLHELFGVVVGGDSCERRKPDPQPLQWAASRLGVPDSAALMVGDSVNDVTAALAAGMAVVCVPYGYNEGQDVRQLPADAFVETLDELPRLLGL
jgi:phosphoglycolate phosphatase